MRALVVSLLPLLLSLLLALFRHNCGLLDGIAWYLLLVPASALISVVLAVVACTLVERRWVRLLLFLLLLSLPLLRGAHEAYWGPHIFMYAWQVGFFPGGSWDAELPISGTLVIYRLGHLLVAGTLLLVSFEYARTLHGPVQRRRSDVAALGALVGIIALVLIPLRSELGLTRTHEWLRQELGDSLHTRFTTIYYDRSRTDSLDIWRAANQADFHVDEHARTLKLDTATLERFTLYLYPSPQEEKRMVGTSSAAFTKPWLGMLNMPIKRAEGTLRHELAHLMLAPFGGLLGVSTSQGLLEGSAMALENKYGNHTLYEYARAMYHFELAPPVEEIMSIGGFSSRRSSLSYVLAGSFSRWLMDRYGAERYLHAYSWGDFEEAYGRSLHELSDEYQAFIDSLPAPSSSYRPTILYHFGGGSFFFQKCLRRIGSLNAEGYEALAAERYEKALMLFKNSLDEGINYSARAGILRALAGLGRHRQLLDSAAAYSRDTASYPLLPMLIEQGDGHWALGDTVTARRMYDSALSLEIAESIDLRARLRLTALSAPPPLYGMLHDYFTRPMSLTQRLLHLQAARQAASEPGAQALFNIMQGSIVADQAPLTAVSLALTSVSPSPDSARVGVNGSGFAINAYLTAMASTYMLHDAWMYSRSIPGSASGNPLFPGQPPASGGGSKDYIREREQESSRFLAYLRTHGAIIP
jgi:hypothetical protein